MPTNLKPSIKHWDRKTGKTTIEHFYLKATQAEELAAIIANENTKPKLKVKCQRELDRRANVKGQQKKTRKQKKDRQKLGQNIYKKKNAGS